MARVALETIGCRLNQYETEKIAEELICLGMTRVAYHDAADLYIVNSCTVTQRADADNRKLISRAYRKNQDAIIVVTGCYVESERETVARLHSVDLVVGNDDKEDLAAILQKNFPLLFENLSCSTSLQTGEYRDDAFGGGVESIHRPMVKIGTGCDQACSYCIVPAVRGKQVSLPPDQIIDDIQRRIADGYHEIVLTAVHIGHYAHSGLNLAALVRRILEKTTLTRLRLSSLEPNELNDDLLDLVASNSRVCRHLHLPLQSGSDRILGMMRRPYRREQYLEVVASVKKANPNITIGCDLIIGFPGESDDDFCASLDIINSGLLDYAHLFSYSDRPGTPASTFPDKIPPQTIKRRNNAAREAVRVARLRHLDTQIGRAMAVISEGKRKADGMYWGISDNYLKVKLPAEFGGRRHIVKFLPTASGNGFLTGNVMPE